jgi:hypothetical protein
MEILIFMRNDNQVDWRYAILGKSIWGCHAQYGQPKRPFEQANSERLGLDIRVLHGPHDEWQVGYSNRHNDPSKSERASTPPTL